MSALAADNCPRQAGLPAGNVFGAELVGKTFAGGETAAGKGREGLHKSEPEN